MDFDIDHVRRIIWAHIRDSNMKAGQAWITATVLSTPIPAWSGASRATFSQLASELGTSVPIGVRSGVRSRAALGRASAAGSGVEESRKRSFAGFTYRTTLRHLIYNEYNQAVKGPYPQPFSDNVRFTPYFFQAIGAVAWNAYAKKVRLPNPFRYLKMKKF